MVVLLALKVKVVSSAYIVVFDLSKQFGKSLMNIRNNSGPNIEHCGTPHLTDTFCDRWPFTRHLWLRFSRYEVKKLNDCSFSPCRFNFSIRTDRK